MYQIIDMTVADTEKALNALAMTPKFLDQWEIIEVQGNRIIAERPVRNPHLMPTGWMETSHEAISYGLKVKTGKRPLSLAVSYM